MGCQIGICTESDELLLSQQNVFKAFEQTSLHSCNSTQRANALNGNSQTAPGSGNRSLHIARSVIKISMKDLPNYLEILEISEIWIEEVKKYLKLNELARDDIKTTIAFDISGAEMQLKHEIDGPRSFEFILQLYSRLKTTKKYVIDLNLFEACTEFLSSLCPLSISIYLKLGVAIDIGIGIDKPMDIKKTLDFLENCSDLKTLESWISLNNHPIATFCWYSLINQSKAINFCIFDGLKAQNTDKALSLLENIGVPANGEIQEFLRKNSADEVNCCMEIIKDKINSISIEIKSEDIGDSMFKVLENGCNYDKWTTFHNLVQPKFIAVELTPSGYSLKKKSCL